MTPTWCCCATSWVRPSILRDRPYADVAQELGVPDGTLRSRVHYALRRLRDLLEERSATDDAA